MRKSKAYHQLIFVVLLVLSLLLTIPKSQQMSQAIASILSNEELNLFENSKPVFLIVGLLMELLSTAVSIFLLKLVYHFAKIELSLIENANSYLLASTTTKALSLILPISMILEFTFINSLLFAIGFVLIHYLLQKDKCYLQKQWLWVLSFPIANILLSLL